MVASSKQTIVLASGGTGGHIFPAYALSEALHQRGYHTVLITDKRHNNYASKPDHLACYTIHSSTMGSGFYRRMKAMCSIATGYLQARRLLKRLQPKAVVGFGGYPSFPTMQAAIRNGFKTIIHEQNSLLGRANYVIADKVDAIATSFPDVNGIKDHQLPKVHLTGNPVRNAIKALRTMEYPTLEEGDVMQILITGGSQGASVFSGVMPQAMALLPETLRKRIRIDQQCRAADIEATRQAYEAIGVSAHLSEFFKDIPSRLAASHLVIARAGASTIAELTMAGRPAILVPYPYAMDDHQTVNANALEDIGGGWLMPEASFTPEAVAAKLESFLKLPDSLNNAAHNIHDAAQEHADNNLADLVEKIIQQKQTPNTEEVEKEEAEASHTSTLDELEHTSR